MAHPVRILLVLSMAVAMTALVLFAGRGRDGGEPLSLSPAAAPTQDVAPTATPGLAFEPVVPEWVAVAAGEQPELGIYVVDLDEGTLWRLRPDTFSEVERAGDLLTWSPSGEAVVETTLRPLASDEESHSWLYIARPGEPFQLLIDELNSGGRVAWSPDGETLAIGIGGVPDTSETRLYDVRSSRTIAVIPMANVAGVPNRDPASAWSPDGRYLWIRQAGPGGVVSAVWDRIDGSIQRLPGAALTWGHSGATLVHFNVPEPANEGLFEIWLRDFAAGSDTLVATTPRFSVGPALSRDDRFLSFAFVEDPKRGLMKTLIVDVERMIPVVAISGSSPFGWLARSDTLLLWGNLCGEHDVFTVRADGSELRNHTRSPELDIDLRVSPDGTQAAFVTYAKDGVRVNLLAIPDGEPHALFSAPLDHLEMLNWSPDGRFLAFDYNGIGQGLCEGFPPQTTTVELLP